MLVVYGGGERRGREREGERVKTNHSELFAELTKHSQRLQYKL